MNPGTFLEITPKRMFDAWLDPEKVRDWMGMALSDFEPSGDVRRVEIEPCEGAASPFSTFARKRPCTSLRVLRSRPSPGSLPRAKAEMLIRKPVAEVFEAFIDPGITSKFRFTGASGRPQSGKRETWEWAMYGFSIPVEVKAIEKNKRIVAAWPGRNGQTSVEWSFTDRGDGTYARPFGALAATTTGAWRKHSIRREASPSCSREPRHIWSMA